VASLKELVIKAVEEKVRPAIRDDGGDIEIVSVDEEHGRVFVRLTGNCEMCAASNVTMQGWVEELIKREVPGVVKVSESIFATGPIPHPSERKLHPPPKGYSPAETLKKRPAG